MISYQPEPPIVFTVRTCEGFAFLHVKLTSRPVNPEREREIVRGHVRKHTYITGVREKPAQEYVLWASHMYIRTYTYAGPTMAMHFAIPYSLDQKCAQQPWTSLVVRFVFSWSGVSRKQATYLLCLNINKGDIDTIGVLFNISLYLRACDGNICMGVP